MGQINNQGANCQLVDQFEVDRRDHWKTVLRGIIGQKVSQARGRQKGRRMILIINYY